MRETKGTDDIEKLQWESEGWKIKFGEAHFNALEVDYAFGHDPEVLVEALARLSESCRSAMKSPIDLVRSLTVDGLDALRSEVEAGRVENRTSGATPA